MPYDSFNWFDCDAEIEEEVLIPTEHKKPLLDRMFDFFSCILLFVFILSFAVYVFILFFMENQFNLDETNLRSVNIDILIVTGSFRLIIFVLSALSFCFKVLHLKNFVRIYQKVYSLTVMLIWMSACLLTLSVFGGNGTSYKLYLKPFLLSGIITSASYIVCTLLMMSFEKHFIKTTLKSKAEETELTEDILNHFKNFVYDITDSSETVINLPTCGDIFCLDLDISKFTTLFKNEPHRDFCYSHIKVDDPEIYSLRDAITLARDVFFKASKTKEILELEEFKSIFANETKVEESLVFFDFNNNFNISKKKFRDTVIYFYKNRIMLDKAIKSTSHFLSVIKKIIYSIVLIFLIIVYLIVFGANVHELFALAISAAIAFNFLGSKLILETWKNIIMLLNHQFDVGDEVMVDDKTMTVYEIGLSTTSFILPNGGKLKVINSDLWNKAIVNMTKAPEKKLLFTLELDGNTDKDKLKRLIHEIKFYLRQRPVEFYDSFVMSSFDDNKADISKIKSTITLRCKAYKTASKKFLLRMEFLYFLNETLARIFENKSH